MSAAHCFLPDKPGDVDSTAVTHDILFAPDVSQVGAYTSLTPYAPGDPRRVRQSAKILTAEPDYACTEVVGNCQPGPHTRGRDVSVMLLDSRVPPSVVRGAVRPAGLIDDGCPSEFDGVLIGYGGTSFNTGGNGTRNYNFPNGYHRDTYDSAQTYDYDFLAGAQVELFWPEQSKGDSGGPLLAQGENHVCGTTNSFFLITLFNPLPAVYVRGAHAALDSSENVAFLQDILMDKSHTYFIGEKPIRSDRDGDGVDDSEDNCPDVWNDDQRDSDRDGFGDRCDNCLTISNDQLDSNLDDETVLNGVKPDGVDGNPRLDPTLPDDTFTKKWPGDACDRHPLTLMTPVSGRYDPIGNDAFSQRYRAGVRSIRCTHVPGLACPQPPPPIANIPTFCDLPHGNDIAAESFVGNYAPPTNTTQKSIVRALACRCMPGDGDCMSACPRTNIGSPPTGMGTWAAMTLDDVPTQRTLTGNVGGPSFASTGKFQETHPMIGFAGASTRSETLGWRYWDDLDGIPVAAETPEPVIMFDGLVWSWVQTHQDAAAGFPAPTDPPTGDPINDWPLRQNVSRAHVYEQAKAVVDDPPCFKEKIWIRPPDLRDCPMCGAGVFFRVTQDVDPAPELVSAGRFVTPAEDFMPPVVVNTMLSTTFRVVTASDTQAWATGSVRAAIVSTVDRTVLFGLASTSDGGLAFRGVDVGLAAASVATAAPPKAAPPFLVALSSHRQDIAFLERGDDGAPLQQLRTFDFDLGQEVVKPLLIRNHQLVDPIAFTYRPDDDAYYVLDRVHDPDPTAVLYRIPRGNTLEAVGSWARRGDLPNVGLTTAADGTLVVSTWSDTKYAVAVLDLDHPFPDEGKHAGQDISKRQIRVATLRFGSGSVVVPAYRNLESTTLVVHDHGDDGAVRIVAGAPKGKGDIDDGDVGDLATAF